MKLWRWVKSLFVRPSPVGDRILVDREGIAYPPTRRVALRAKKP